MHTGALTCAAEQHVYGTLRVIHHHERAIVNDVAWHA